MSKGKASAGKAAEPPVDAEQLCIGVLALQGAFEEHAELLQGLNCKVKQVRCTLSAGALSSVSGGDLAQLFAPAVRFASDVRSA